MPRIVYIEHDGTEHVVDAAVGATVMQTAVDHLIPGIIGDCGGCCSCATCHAFVDPQWVDKIPPAHTDEHLLLQGAVALEAGSRLTCQIEVRADLDGLVVRLPRSQM